MPQDKDFKRIVRARMAKTGESYTAARAALVAKASPKPPKPAAPEAQWAELAGTRDDAVAAKTGRTWAQWVSALDDARVWTWTHTEIAKHVRDNYAEVSAWWAQTITVGYERIRGLREVGQRRGGTFDANKSRTFPVDVATLYRMFSEARRRKRWLGEGLVKVRTSKVNTSMRLDWEGDTRVALTFLAKGPAKSSVSVQHSLLANKDAVETTKQAWHVRLDALRDVLAR